MTPEHIYVSKRSTPPNVLEKYHGVRSSGKLFQDPPPTEGRLCPSLNPETLGNNQKRTATMEKTALSEIRQARRLESIDLNDTIAGQFAGTPKKRLLRIITKVKERNLFPVDPKKCSRLSRDPVLRIPLRDEVCKPGAVKQRRLLTVEKKLWKKSLSWNVGGPLGVPNQNGRLHQKKKHTLRLYQDYCILNTLVKTNSGRPGDLQSIRDQFHGPMYFTTIDLASGFFHIEIANRISRGLPSVTPMDSHGRIVDFVDSDPRPLGPVLTKKNIDE